LTQRTRQSATIPLSPTNESEESQLKRNRTRSIAVALASFALSIANYFYQLSHPVTAIEILADMQSNSAPLSSIANGKPTLIDFWAPWCENCKYAAPTLRSIEEEYGDRVNFLMVNADERRNWPLIELFGVDAIPHLAFVSGEGDVETALIGPMSRRVLRADIDALLKSGDCKSEETIVVDEPVQKKAEQSVCHEELPYKMYDAFGKRPESRRIKFVEQ
jgi:thiol-disulfide isomerase/thioredoxin